MGSIIFCTDPNKPALLNKLDGFEGGQGPGVILCSREDSRVSVYGIDALLVSWAYGNSTPEGGLVVQAS